MGFSMVKIEIKKYEQILVDEELCLKNGTLMPTPICAVFPYHNMNNKILSHAYQKQEFHHLFD